MPGGLLLAFYLAVALAPVLLSWMSNLPPRPFWDEVSSAMAMTAFAVLLIEFFLSGRFRLISRKIGIDQTMRFHQLFARTILVLVLVHPFIYTLPVIDYPPPWDSEATGFLQLNNLGFLTGAAAWVLLGVLILTGIARDSLPYRYETWRLSHGVGAVLVAALTAIHTLETGRYSETEPLRYFWFILLAVAAASLLYVYLISPLLKLRSPFEVLSVRKIADRTWELTIGKTDKTPFNFEAGQFAWLSLHPHPFTLRENPFSISSAPSDGEKVQFVIKELGDFTRSLAHVELRQRAWLDGPHGAMTPPFPNAPGVGMIAGGVGIAPLLSIVREMRASGDKRPIILLYGNRREDQIVYGEELQSLQSEGDFTVAHVLGEPPEGWSGATGMIDAEKIKTTFCGHKGYETWAYLLCGPPPMLDVTESALIEQGVPPSRIVSERFVYD